MTGSRNPPVLLLPKFKGDCILAEGVEIGRLLGGENERVVRVRPCASEKGKIIAEMKLQSGLGGAFLDPELLCEFLDACRRKFVEEKCSSELGVARFTWKERRVYLFKNGKVNVRFALSREDAFRTLYSVMKLVLGSVICRWCGRPAIGCASGTCGECITAGEPELISTGDLLNGIYLKRSYDRFVSALAETEALKDALMEDATPPSPVDGEFRRNVQGALELALEFSLKTDKWMGTKVGLELASLILSLEGSYEAIENITQNLSKMNEEIVQRIRRLAALAWEINVKALRALEKGDLQFVAEAGTEYRRFQKETDRLQSEDKIGGVDSTFLSENIRNAAGVGAHVIRIANSKS